MAKGNIFYIPKTNIVTAVEVVVGTSSYAQTTNPLNTTGITLTINQWYEAPVGIDYMTRAQTQADVGGIAATEAAYAVGVAMDTSVAALFSALNGSVRLGADNTAITDDVILAAKLVLDEGNVPMDSNRSLILDPSGLVDMLKIDKFIAADYVNQGAVVNGLIGKSPIYGCKVKVTNNLVATGSGGAYACMLHKNAIAGKAQIEKSWKKEFEELHLTLYNAEALWGVIEAQDSFGVALITRHA
jgi:hypothetical protein